MFKIKQKKITFSGKIPIFHLGDSLKVEGNACKAVQPPLFAVPCENDR
jgi:hypothetical protein